ncbi:MAG: MBL fold metallo-hydrolase [Ilumatobacter sp.]|uniref:MBL fold metallo-hydrolase n=1 Tax=Ilumatobacter sp. TaxID=1967498 RepID=UPI00329857FD
MTTRSGSTTGSALTFVGGAGTVTGSKTLLDTPGGRLLVDCGLFQGRKQLRLQNWDDFPVDPASIDVVVLTHAHIDHCGYLPRLAAGGFSGPVYCTHGTSKLAAIVLPDSGHLHEEEAAYANRKGYSKHDPALPLYTEEQAYNSLDLIVPVDFDQPLQVLDGVTATWRRAGHILGAASIDIQLSSTDAGRPTGRHVIFSGDLGRSNHPLLVAPSPLEATDVLITESTYGDRRRAHADPAEVIADTVNESARRGGVVVVPAFAVDRTEVILWHLDQLVAAGRIPVLPTFVDSPMALSTLDVYRSEARDGSPEIRPEYHGKQLFSSLQLRESRSVEQSKEISARPGPMIIISASGMATGGRILHHLAQRMGDDRNAVMLVGFQAPGTRGDLLRQGARSIKLLGRHRLVRATVVSVELSAHADQDELVTWARTAAPAPDIVYVNHGEPEASTALIERLELDGGLVAVAPRPGERVLVDG